MSYLLVSSFSFLLMLFSNQQPQQAEYTVSVQGRAVDSSGRPVKDARIVVSPLPEPVMGDISYLVKADSDGRFRYSEKERDPRTERLLYVVGPFHEGAVSLFRPPFYWLVKIPNERYDGRRIRIKPNGQLDVGDVPIQVRYETINVRIQDRSGIPILVNEDKWKRVWVRIRNPRREVICEKGLSPDDIHRKVNLSESMIPIDLPEGTWELEVSTRGHRGPWHSSTAPLRVSSESGPIDLTLRISEAKNGH